MEVNTQQSRRIPIHFWIGLILIGVFWWTNWMVQGYRSHWSFFPLWLGYILTVDGLNVRHHGSSLLSRNTWLFVVLFVVSAPSWWLFEALNQRAGYWQYLGVESFSTFSFASYCTLNFSIVMPAIFETSELFYRSVFRMIPSYRTFGHRPWHRVLLFVLGLLMLAVVLIWPRYGLIFLWMSLFFIIDPINYRLGYPSLLRATGRGDWSQILGLFAGGIICGFFWELWNLYSWPKWIYHLPFFDYWHVFEMPLTGYLGYLPFSLELFAMASLVFGLIGRHEYIRNLWND